MEENQTTPTLAWVANQMGYSQSGISRLMSGDRNPSLNTMRVVERVFGWGTADQVTAPNWIEGFKRVTKEKFNND